MALPAAATDKRISIGTAGTAGALYPMGVAMAETINRHVPGYKASAEASSASLENIRNLAQGNVDWAISQNEVAFLAYNGEGKYKGPRGFFAALFVRDPAVLGSDIHQRRQPHHQRQGLQGQAHRRGRPG